MFYAYYGGAYFKRAVAIDPANGEQVDLATPVHLLITTARFSRERSAQLHILARS